MRIVLQRVKKASVSAGGNTIASIDGGFLLLVGVGKEDSSSEAKELAEKISKLRVFEDAEGKMNLDVREVKKEALSVPQFTLLGSTDKGNRPGFDNAANPDKAKSLWKEFNSFLSSSGIRVEEGVFGAHMEVSLINDGPVTFVLDSKPGKGGGQWIY